MHHSFLKHTAKYIFDKHASELGDVWIVFPNQRASLFFQRFLANHVKRPTWSPSYFTISELFQKLGQWQTADDISLVFDLYHVYTRHKPDAESFNEFYFWGEMLLNDFDDVDKYMVDAKDLYQNVESLKEIEARFAHFSDEQLKFLKYFWKSFEVKDLSRYQEEFKTVWKILFPVYKDFKSRLQEKDMAYEGMLYREVAESLEKNQVLDILGKKIFFIGFNALNTCEIKLFKYLSENGLAEFTWDYDQYYIQQPNHEAGFFLRDNLKRFPGTEMPVDRNTLSEQEKRIDVYQASSDTGQARLIPTILSRMDLPADKLEETAIVLADEHLLFAVLFSIPEEIPFINVTMGYPVQHTPLYSYIRDLVSLQRDARVDKEGKLHFYYKDVLSVLKHPFTGEDEKINQRVAAIEKQNRVYLEPEGLQEIPLHGQLFVKKENVQDLVQYLLDAIYNAMKKAGGKEKENDSPLEKEFFYSVYLSIQRLGDIINNQELEMGLPVFLKILERVLENLTVPFSGEPLKGLQVLGILETRAIDFKNVIILSMNEGILPKTSVAGSYIPFNLRKAFHLPTIHNQDAIYAYYFYRLMQRAENIALVYNSSADESRTGEMSRYIYQLQYESPHELHFHTKIYPIGRQLPVPITIEKDIKVMEKLAMYTSGNTGPYLSPTALIHYITCPLKFYFHAVARIREPEELKTEVDALEFGNLLHHALYELYKPYQGNKMDKDTLQGLVNDKDHVDKIIYQGFQKEYFKNTGDKEIPIEGKNIVIQGILKKYMEGLLQLDSKKAPFIPVSLEQEVLFSTPAENTQVRLGGKIDRVDKLGDEYRVIDYKTGQDDARFQSVETLFLPDAGGLNKAAFQLLFYALVYQQSGKGHITATPQLYSIPGLFGNQADPLLFITELKTHINQMNIHGILEEFKGYLEKLVGEIFNPKLSFPQTSKEENCTYCPYVDICHRDGG